MRKEKLKAIGTFLGEIAERSESVYWLSSPDFTKIEYISPAYEKIWGRSRAILYAEPELWSTYLHPDDLKDHHPIHSMAERVRTLGKEARYEENYRIIRPDGEVRWILDRGFPIYDKQDHCCGVTGVATDITKEKQIEKELRQAKEIAESALLAKTKFFTEMSHDLKTPLSGIIGIANILKVEVENPTHRQHAIEIMQAGEQLMTFFENCLRAVKLANFDVVHSIEPFSLDLLLHDLTNLFQPAARQRGLEFHIIYKHRISAYLVGSRACLHRVLLNLIGNALKYTDKGYVTLTAEIFPDRTSGQKEYGAEKRITLVLSLKDTGIGIPPEKKSLIFERFTRATTQSQRQYEGFGLGLNIVKDMVESMQGTITVESNVGKGSLFTIVLSLPIVFLKDSAKTELKTFDAPTPYKPAIKEPIEPVMYAPLPSVAALSPVKVLLIEDSLLAQRIAQSMLAAPHFSLDVAGHPTEALALFKPGKYHLVLTDIGLPDMTGEELAKKLRHMEMDSPYHVPIIALTAYLSSSARTEGRTQPNDEIDTFLAKPLSYEKLAWVIERYLSPPKAPKMAVAEKRTPYGSKGSSSASIKKDKLYSKDTFSGEIKMNTPQTDGNLLPIIEAKASQELLKMLMDSLPDFREKISQAYSDQDMQRLRQHVHHMHGGVCYTSTPQLLHAVRTLEDALVAKQYDTIDSLYQALLNALDTFEAAYLRYCERE